MKTTVVASFLFLVSCASETDCIDPSKIDKSKLCTFIYKPVCGCDDKTYSNACTAEGAGVTTWAEGECPK